MQEAPKATPALGALPAVFMCLGPESRALRVVEEEVADLSSLLQISAPPVQPLQMSPFPRSEVPRVSMKLSN